MLFISCALDVLILFVFPHDYICAFLIVSKSHLLYFQSHFNNTNTFVIKVKSFPEVTDILLPEQCKTSGGYWHKLKLEGALYSSNLGFQKSTTQAIISPLPSRN